MGIRYIYIDDEALGTLESLSEGVALATELEIDCRQPTQFKDQVASLVEATAKYDGIILDWRLDQNANAQGERVSFRAATIAQELRTRGTEAKLREVPIVLWSTYQRLKCSYFGDRTSHDLFDRRFDKMEQILDVPDTVRTELIALATGYQLIASRKTSGFAAVLGLRPAQFEKLDPRFTNTFPKRQATPVHEYARFILKEAILTPGLLIEERLLAARLGIDLQASSDWGRLVVKLPSEAKYEGPFASAWPRWWSPIVERDWWRSLQADGLPALSALCAKDRVAIISTKTRLKGLKPAEPIRPHYGTRFQTLCEYYKRPLDTSDGVLLDDKEPLPWQNRRYVSVDVVLESKHAEKGLKVHPLEIDRIKDIKRRRSR
jgi:hypothetical protein